MLSTTRPAAARAFRLLLPVALSILAATLSGVARADDTAAVAAPAPPAPTPAPAAKGLAVVAVGNTAGVAWPLAQRVYAVASLRPAALDEARARVLAGEGPAPHDGADIRDLAEMRAAVKGDDAPSRAVLTSIAHAANARGLVVVTVAANAAGVDAPVARVFVVDGASFDAATFAPDPPASSGVAAAVTWDGAVRSLARAFGTPSPADASPLATTTVPSASTQTQATPAPAAALAPVVARPVDEKSTSHPFYTSPWFWGAVGAALVGTAAVYFGTRDNTSTTIHLQMQVPK